MWARLPRILANAAGSPFGEHALPLALALARKAGATLHLVHVHSPLTAMYLEGAGFLDESLDAHLLQQEQDYLDTVVRRLTDLAPVVVTSELLEGGITHTLAEHAVQTRADLVVMTTHGRGALGRFWLGSVADELVRRLPMPLLLIRPHQGAPDFSTDPLPRHLLLPLDGAALGEQMIDTALAYARLTGAEVTLLRVVKPVLPGTYSIEGYTVDEMVRSVVDRIEQLQRHVGHAAEEYLGRVAIRFHEKGIPVQTKVVVEQQPAVAILRAAEAGAGMIALETHGRKGLARLLLGSVADKVIRGTSVPVLVHRPLNP
ncbi:MAG: universal stress protein [Planctomycetes bacterium]|nr:universal stress protein [Planctomycetota bacterium]